MKSVKSVTTIVEGGSEEALNDLNTDLGWQFEAGTNLTVDKTATSRKSSELQCMRSKAVRVPGAIVNLQAQPEAASFRHPALIPACPSQFK